MLCCRSVFFARTSKPTCSYHPSYTVLPKYLAYLLVSKTYKSLLLSVGEGGGATRQAITKAEIEQFKISYPSNIDEQITIIENSINCKQALNLKAI